MIVAAPLAIPAAEAVWAAVTAVGTAIAFVATKAIIDESFIETPPSCIQGCPNLGAPLQYHAPPKNLPAFPDAEVVNPKTPVKGGGKLRKRWKDSNGDIYEWDYQHGTVERYNKEGKHKGEFNPKTGEQTKPANPGRKVEK
ncbi:colicin E3/pyocin S6 family cytotoxin [Azospirillum brasilense]|uniref:colicin E3/pyocin S6 family cytotoxin n=1 Tax=Azospirillum brasilense TaxID=192 RepID=UPI000E0C6A75|nr:colicin E3/pyocin S6 family cytotoxin [Azospirillum brasilense]